MSDGVLETYSPRWFGAAVVGAVLYGAGMLALIVMDVGGVDAGHYIARGGVLGAAMATTLACALAGMRTGGRIRRGWTLLAFGASFWTLSNGLALVTEITDSKVLPVPSPADLPSALAVLLVALAILSFLEPALSSAGRMRSLMDGLLIASSLVFVAWALVIEDLYNQTGQGEGRVLALAYPVSDVILLALVLLTITRMNPASRLPWILLASGLALFGIGHTAFAYLEVARAYEPGGLDSVSWVFGCLALGLAALAPHTHFNPGQDEPRARGAGDIVVPLLPVLLAGAAAWSESRKGPLSFFLIVNLGVVGILLIARQLLAQFENLELARQLERRVDQRTSELKHQEQQFRAVVQNASDVLTVVDASGVIRYQSASVDRVLGYRFGELVGTRIDELFHPDDREELSSRVRGAPAPPEPPMVLEAKLRRKDGGWTLAETSIANLLAQESVHGLLLTSRDIGPRRELEDQLRHQALHDPLTGLGNRILFTDRLEHAVARASRNPEMLAVLLLDLDGFKQVNDSLGHSAGDALLAEVAIRLQDSIRPGDTVARMGGDEFAILLERATDEGPAVVAQRILFRLRAPVEIDGKPLVVQGSVGIAVGSTHAFTAEGLLRNADLAMYEAKSRGKGAFEVFEPTMHAAALHRVELEADLRRAMREKELVLYYQSVVELPTGRIAGAEALVRWLHPERGLVPPNDFIGIAEESDLVHSLGRWVLREACRQAVEFQAMYRTEPPFTMAVNVSSRQLTSQWLVKEVKDALEETGLAATALVLEITEGALMSDAAHIYTTLEDLRALGVGLAIDDFGTGWSSLSRLRSFPVDKLKIDKSFISEINSADDEAPIVAAIVAMAHSLHLSTVAEGVETYEQLACLYHHGCEEVQGYLLSRPVPSDQFAAHLAEGSEGLETGQVTPLSSAEQEFAGVVHEVARPPGGLADIVHPVLEQLQRVTGADLTFLTEINWPDVYQEVRAACGADGSGLQMREGSRLRWSETPASAMLQGGTRCISDLGFAFPDDDLVRQYGIASLVVVPVETADGRVYGTLCAASLQPRGMDDTAVVLLELFARLLVEHLNTEAGLGVA